MIVRKRISEKFSDGSIFWVGVEKSDGGFFLYQFENETKPCKWDSFYTDVQDLLQECEENWGLNQSNWTELAMLEKGISGPSCG